MNGTIEYATARFDEWRCPRCLEKNDGRFCHFCKWDIEQPYHEPLRVDHPVVIRRVLRT